MASNLELFHWDFTVPGEKQDVPVFVTHLVRRDEAVLTELELMQNE